MKVTAEGKEIVLKNDNGDVIIIPKTHRKEVLKHLQNGDYSAIDRIAESLPYMEDYADDGTLVPVEPDKPVKKVPQNVMEQAKSSVHDIINNLSYEDLTKQYYNEMIENPSNIGLTTNMEDFNKDIKSKYPTNVDLIQAMSENKKRSQLAYDRLTAYQNKLASVEDPDYSTEIQQIRESQKTAYGKNTDNIQYIKSSVKGFDKTPIHKKIKEDIYKAADKIGMDRHEALALAIVESNAGATTQSDRHTGKAIFTAHNATGFDNPMLHHLYTSRYNASTLSLNDYLQKAKVKNLKYITDPETKEKLVDVNSIPLKDYEKYNKEYLDMLNKEQPSASNTVEAALKFYSKNPQGYNPGNKNYVNTIKGLAQQLKEQKI